MSYRLYDSLRLNGRDYIFLCRSLLKKHSNDNTFNVLCNSFPKSGTHLLSQILMQTKNISYWNDIVSVQALSGFMNTEKHIKWKLSSVPDNSLVRSHLMHQKEILDVLKKRKYKLFFIYRDLRDVALSHAKWVLKEKRFFLHKLYKENFLSDDECLMASIKGIPLGSPFGNNSSQPNIGEDFSRWHGWIEHPETLSVKFEDLVGSRGGGTDEARWACIRNILNHLEFDIDEKKMYELFSFEAINPKQSHTFRKGQIDGWKKAFTEEHKKAFKRVAGDLLIELGYEKDLSW